MEHSINAALKLVFPIRSVEKPDPKNPKKQINEAVLWAYHTPISQEVFRGNFRVIAAAKDALFHKGIDYAATTGVAIADLELREAARQIAEQHDLPDSGDALMAEFKRLTLIVTPGPKGFESVPIDTAIQRKIITADEWHDAECLIVFFTCASTIALRSKRSTLAEATASVLKGSMTSLSPTEFAGSLQISTSAVGSEKPAALLVPS